MTDEICGYEGTTTGEPCRHPAGSCPVPSHTDEDAENNQGRPSKLTDEREEIIEDWIRDLRTLRSAAEKADVTYRTVKNWLDEGERQINTLDEDEHGREAEFFQVCADARADAKAELLDRMDNPDVDWRMIAWKLERLYREEFYLPIKQEIEQSVDMDADVDASHDVTAEFVTYSAEGDDVDE